MNQQVISRAISATALPLLVIALVGSYIFPTIVGALWAKQIVRGMVQNETLAGLLAWLYAISMQVARFALAGAAAEEMCQGRKVQAASGLALSVILTAWNVGEGLALVRSNTANSSDLAGMVIASAILGLLIEIRLVINLADEGQAARQQKAQQPAARPSARQANQTALFPS